LGKLRAANEKKLAAAEATQQTVKTNFDNMKQAQAKSEKEKSAKQKTDKLKPTKGLSLAESYSDYELYQILKENSFKTTENNLRILKEKLDNYDAFIINKDIFNNISYEDVLEEAKSQYNDYVYLNSLSEAEFEDLIKDAPLSILERAEFLLSNLYDNFVRAYNGLKLNESYNSRLNDTEIFEETFKLAYDDLFNSNTINEASGKTSADILNEATNLFEWSRTKREKTKLGATMGIGGGAIGAGLTALAMRNPGATKAAATTAVQGTKGFWATKAMPALIKAGKWGLGLAKAHPYGAASMAALAVLYGTQKAI